MTNLFVPYYLAKEARDRGFDEPCLRYYTKKNSKLSLSLSENGDINSRLSTILPDYITAPTYGQLADWFRTKKNMEITVHTISNVNEILGYEFTLYSPMSWPVFRITLPGRSWDYWDVWNEAFENAFAGTK